MTYKELKTRVHELIEEDPYAKGEDDHSNLLVISGLIAEYFKQLDDTPNSADLIWKGENHVEPEGE